MDFNKVIYFISFVFIKLNEKRKKIQESMQAKERRYRKFGIMRVIHVCVCACVCVWVQFSHRGKYITIVENNVPLQLLLSRGRKKREKEKEDEKCSVFIASWQYLLMTWQNWRSYAWITITSWRLTNKILCILIIINIITEIRTKYSSY